MGLSLLYIERNPDVQNSHSKGLTSFLSLDPSSWDCLFYMKKETLTCKIGFERVLASFPRFDPSSLDSELNI